MAGENKDSPFSYKFSDGDSHMRHIVSWPHLHTFIYNIDNYTTGCVKWRICKDIGHALLTYCFFHFCASVSLQLQAHMFIEVGFHTSIIKSITFKVPQRNYIAIIIQ